MKSHFIWYELMTEDPKGAIAFYSEVAGWKTQAFGDGATPYSMWVGRQGPLGGVHGLTEEMKQRVPAHWISHVEVADVDQTMRQAEALGARTLVPAKDIPTVGRFAVFMDPQGAVLAVFTPLASMAQHDTSVPGEFSWNELVTTDATASLKFYGALFGWQQLAEHDMGPAGKYTLFGLGAEMFGGMMNKPPEQPGMPCCWVYYIRVDALDGAIARAKQGGAKLLFGPQEVPGGSFVAQLVDPQGVHFALHADRAK